LTFQGCLPSLKKSINHTPNSLTLPTFNLTGGWDRITEEFPQDLGQEIDQAFENVEHTLRKAGGKGWEQVYKVRAYFAPATPEAFEHSIRNLRKYCPNHQPLLTAVEVKWLYNNMRIEIEVAAHLG